MGKKNRKMIESAAGNQTVDKYIDVLDGLRCIGVLMVVWLHFWEQTWITPYINFNNQWTKYIGITESHLHSYVRFGAVFTDLMILISAICNLWPYARSIVLGEEWPDTKTFYKKRALRILPSYYLSVLVTFIIALVEDKYVSTGFMWKDLFSRITFTSIWFPDLYVGTKLNGALWTVQVEFWFYLIIPLLAVLFKKRAVITCGVLWLIGIIGSNIVIYNIPDNVRGYANHPLLYTGFYANGMLICICYAMIKKAQIENKYTQLFATFMAFAGYIGFDRLIRTFTNQDKSYMKVTTRFEMMILFSVIVFALMLANPHVKKMFSNKITKFITVISYNLYIWHQVIAFWFKDNRIPYWEGDTPPNITGDIVWQWKYQFLIVFFSFVVAIVTTYGFELPIAKYLRKKLKV